MFVDLLIALILESAAIVLGIKGCRQQHRNKQFAVFGLVFSLIQVLVILGMALVSILFNLYGANFAT